MQEISKSTASLPQTSSQRQQASRMISYISSLYPTKLSYFYQLLANGLDNVDPSTPFNIYLNFKPNLFEFSHSGKLWSMKNIRAVVEQSSTKNQELGVGLMSVFKVTQNVEVQGIMDGEGEGEGEKRSFSLEVQRPIESIHRLSQQIKISKDSLNELHSIKETETPLGERITTRFRLLVNRNFEEDVEEIRSNLIYLFAFNKDLAKVQITLKGETKTYVRPILEDHKLGCKSLFLDIEGVKTNRLFLIERQNQIVALPVFEKDDQSVLQKVKQNQSIFKRYLLKQNIQLPFIVHSNKFQLDLTRNQLIKSDSNNSILQKTITLSFQLLKLIIPSLQNRQLLLSFNVSQSQSYLNINNSYKQFISHQPLIKLSDKSYSSLSSIKFPLIQSSNYVPQTFIKLSNQFFYFVNHFLSYPLNQQVYFQCLQFIYSDLSDWLNYIKSYQLKQFITDLQTIQTTKFIKNIQSMDQFAFDKQRLIIQYMNQLYIFLQKQFPVELFNPSNKIALNFNYKLRKTKGLFSLPFFVPEQLIEFLFYQFKFDLKQILLAPGINKDLFDLDEYEIDGALDVFIKSLEKQNLELVDLIRIFRFISIYSEREINGQVGSQKKIIYDLFKNLQMFKDVNQVITQHSLNIDYSPFIQRLVDSIFHKVQNSLDTINTLDRLFQFSQQSQVINWFNNFQALLNKNNYDKIFTRNLNRNGTFQIVSELLSADESITDLEIELFNKLPVQISIQDNSANYRYEKIEEILLDERIDVRLFYKQNISPLSIEELLDSMKPQFKSIVDEREEYNEKSEIMLDYCDDLQIQYDRHPTQDLELKIDIMRQIRKQTAQALLILRLRSNEDKEFIWRLMRDRKSYQVLKELIRKYGIQAVVRNANDYPILSEQYRVQVEQIKILRGEKDRVGKEYELRVARINEQKELEFRNMTETHEQQLRKIEQLNSKNVQKVKELTNLNETLAEQIKILTQKKQNIQEKYTQRQDVDNQKSQLVVSLQKTTKELKQSLNTTTKVLKDRQSQIAKLNQLLEKIKVQLAQVHEINNSKFVANLKQSNQKEDEQQKIEQKIEESKQQQQQSKSQTKEESIIKQSINSITTQTKVKTSTTTSLTQNQNQVVTHQQQKIEKKQQNLDHKEKQLPVIEAHADHKQQRVQEQYETMFNEIVSEKYNYDQQTQCFIISSQQAPEQKAYLMIRPENKQNVLSHQLLNKIHKIKMNLYFGIVPLTATKEDLFDSMRIYSVWDLQIDKWYMNLKEAESKKNAAVRAKTGNGGFWFNYAISPQSKPNIKPKTFEEFRNQIDKNKIKK